MTNAIAKSTLCLLAALYVATPAMTQSGSPAASPTPSPATAAPAASGTYSIEAEILAYRSLHVNSTAIATDVTAALKDTKLHVLVVPSVSVILPAFQQWRANMAIIGNFQAQYAQGRFADDVCSLEQRDKKPAEDENATIPASFSTSVTAVQAAVSTVQTILSMFASSQTVAEFPGTITDQALITAVSRGLKTRGFEILIPDMYTSWTIADVDPEKFPFLNRLADLIQKHGSLQQIYQCDTLVVSAGSQLQQAEATRDADYAKLVGLDPTSKDGVAVLSEIGSMTAQISLLRQKIGLAKKVVDALQKVDNIITDKGVIIATKTSTPKEKADALVEIKKQEATISEVENQQLLHAALRAAQSQSLVTGIEGYLAGLTGGAVSLSSPAPASAPVTAAAATPPGGAAATANAATAPATPPATPAASAPAAATAPILSILQMDGLARRMGLRLPCADTDAKCTAANPHEEPHSPGDWRILWLKAMESGGADITQTNIFGSKPYFGGGAVSGYALFKLDGSLECSGNVAAYGGYVKAKDFEKHGGVIGGTVPNVMLNLEGGCAAGINPSETDELKKVEVVKH